MKRVLVPLLICLLLGEANAEEAAYVGRGPQDMGEICAGLPFYDRVYAYYPVHASNIHAPGRAVNCTSSSESPEASAEMSAFS